MYTSASTSECGAPAVAPQEATVPYEDISTEALHRLVPKEYAERVLAAMSGLPDLQRDVAFSVLVEDRSYKETAALLDIPQGTVMSSLSRARKSLSGKILGEGRLQ